MTRVLVADDDPANREFLRVLLSAQGFQVEVAANGREALAAALRQPPELLVTDLLMPELDGYGLLQRWRAEPSLRERPAIVYTATYTDPRDESLALQMGADAFLVKPLEPQPLMSRILQVLQGARSGARTGDGADAEHEEGTLRLYNEVLVRKLESKMRELEGRVSELTATQQQVDRLGRRHAVLSATNHAIVYAKNRGELLQRVCHIVVEQGGAAIAWVGLIDGATGAVMPAASWGAASEWLAQLPPLHVGEQRAPAEIALARGETFVSNDLLAEPALAGLHPRFREAGLNSAGACPLRVGEDVVGVFSVLARPPGFFDDFSVDLLNEIAADVSFALQNYEQESIRREAQEELARLNADLEVRIERRTAQLRQANEEMRTFSYSVSHDLRAPLASIAGFTSHVLEDPGLPASAAKHLQKVKAAASRMSELIDDLLMLAHVSQHELRWQAIDVSGLCAQVADTLRASEPARDAQFSIEAGLQATGDPGLVRIALENLLGNAWKFTSRKPAGRIEIGRQVNEGVAAFYVRDNGDGFDMAAAHRLFTPFQRLHSATEFAGTGIGLSIVQRVVHKHGGRIWCDSRPGEGTTFWFSLSETPPPAA